MKYRGTAAALAAFILAIGIGSAAMAAGPLVNCSQTLFQARPIDLGVSGGNIHAFFNNHRICTSGTLGSEVQNTGGTAFVLSNNHVLADVNKATPGQLIVQPGLADEGCQKFKDDAVAKFSKAVPINFGGKNTVDAAIAQVISGDVNSEILNIGPIAATTVTASPGLAVQKMGSNTCLTAGTITAVAMKGKVGYPGGKTAKFVDQIVIAVQDFGGPGDSGSLIVTQDSCPQAVGLLFAGTSDQSQTIANPISDVLTKLKVTMVGGCTAATAAPRASDEAGNIGMSKEVVDSAKAVRDRHEDQLMSIPGAVGTAIGIGDQPGQASIEVYIKKATPEAQAAAPKDVEGVPVKLIENGGFVAY